MHNELILSITIHEFPVGRSLILEVTDTANLRRADLDQIPAIGNKLCFRLSWRRCREQTNSYTSNADTHRDFACDEFMNENKLAYGVEDEARMNLATGGRPV